MFGKNKKNEVPVVPPDTSKTAQILRTFEHSELDPSRVVLVGSAALYLYGAELETEERALLSAVHTHGRPRDLDLAALPSYMRELEARAYNHGLLGSPGEETIGQTIVKLKPVEPDDLPIDLITSFTQKRGNIEYHDRKFYKGMSKHSRPVVGTNMRITSPGVIEKELKRRARLDPKAAADLASWYRIKPGL